RKGIVTHLRLEIVEGDATIRILEIARHFIDELPRRQFLLKSIGGLGHLGADRLSLAFKLCGTLLGHLTCSFTAWASRASWFCVRSGVRLAALMFEDPVFTRM